MGVGCRLWRLPPSWFWNDGNEVAEVMAIGTWFQSLMVRGKKELNRTGWLVCSWCRRTSKDKILTLLFTLITVLYHWSVYDWLFLMPYFGPKMVLLSDLLSVFFCFFVFWETERECLNDSATTQFLGLVTRAEMWTLRTPPKVPE